jgi:nitroreductase
MDAIELLLTRTSNGKLSEPGPDEETLQLAFRAAVRAPDHATLRPWHFRVVRRAARERLGEVFRDALRKREPDADEAALDKAARKPLRAPVIIVVSARVCEHPKVPQVEQLLSAGAAAQNIMLTLHARGYAGIWRTGAPAYDDHVKRALGLGDDERIVGFLYAGTPTAPTPAIRRPDPEAVVQEWTGPQ